MTNYDKIRNMSIPDLATFITVLCNERDDLMLHKLDTYGIQCSVVRPAIEVQIADNVAYLMSEVDDDT